MQIRPSFLRSSRSLLRGGSICVLTFALGLGSGYLLFARSNVSSPQIKADGGATITKTAATWAGPTSAEFGTGALARQVEPVNKTTNNLDDLWKALLALEPHDLRQERNAHPWARLLELVQNDATARSEV